MNITELDSYNLADAVKFNKELNPVIWTGDKMRPEVRSALMKIAQDFAEFLGVSDIEIQDITVSGSNAGYTYTPHSDIDLHLVVDLPQADADPVYRELFDAKKYQYNDLHNITIGGYDVELYVENANQPPRSAGIFSVLNNDWVKIPRQIRATVDDEAVRSKFEDLGHRIESAVDSKDSEQLNTLVKKIKRMREAGLADGGEFSPENLAYKMLRNQGMIKQLYDARNSARDAELSLNERRKKKKKKVKYAYGGYWYPGYGFAGSGEAPADGGGDGGGESRYHEDLDTDGIMSTKASNMSSESAGDTKSDSDTVQDFVKFCVKKLKIETQPEIRFKRDPAWSKRNKTFGVYNHDTNQLTVSLANRHIMDILRTVAHELTHQRQGEVADIPDHAGETGSRWENEANAKAGVLMREYGQLHPDLFAEAPVDEGWKQNVAAGILGAGLALGSGSASADTVQPPTQQVQVQKNELFKKYYDALVQRAKENGQTLDTRTLNRLKAKAQDLAQAKIQQQPQTSVKPAGQFPSQGSETRRAKDFDKFEEDVDESLKGKLGALAAAACVAGTPGCATTTAGAVRDAQTVARTAQTAKNLTKAGVKAELDQEIRNFIQAQGQGPGSANAKNQSRLYQLQKKAQQNEASGYIPTKKQAKLPQFSNALSVDVHPGQVGKEANKMHLHTDAQGHPQLLIKNLKNALREFKETGKLDRLGNQTPPGPESKPTMPAGTLRVDVSDVYDWYKLGQHISDMEGLGQHDFGQGPPSSIISFGDENTEHKFIQDLKATGLDVTDIDPADPAKRAGKKIKTDPTYNVTEELLDLTRMYQGYEHVIGQVIDRTDKKVRIKIVAATGKGKLKAGDVIAVAPNYVKRMPVAESCWDGYRQQGMKKKGDRRVPNCVPVGEEEQLDEVKMSPTALTKFANSPEAQGILAGFEAELIFRDAQRDEDEGEMEPDYDADERPYSIQHVIDFFTNDDYGYGLTDRQADRLREQLDEAYFEWRDDQIIDAFNRESEDLVREVWLEERPMTERILSALVDGIGMDDAEADRILAAGDKAPRFTKNSDQEAYKEINPDYATYLEAVNIADEILDEEVEASIDNQDGYYDQALDNFRDGYDEDDSSFFSDIGLRWMSDVANEYNLDWPVVTGSSEGSGGRSWDEIASSLQDATGMRVRTGGGYHSIKRGDYYVIEPDGSLDPDDYDDAGLEIVSPPMPLNQAIEQLQTVIDWANGPGNAYTNSSTGLHMGVSIPFKGGNVDYLKLILFMGDKYILDKFGRAANTYTASAMEKLKQNVAGSKNRNDDKITSAMELMKNNLLELAQKYVQQGVGNSKYTSAHIKDGYIEFRSPGGDYLAKADEEIGVLEDTMRRFAYAMYLAGRPDLERPEYYKKLYKLIAPEGNRDLELFSKFSSGEITAEQLKKQWAEKVIAKEVPSDNKKSIWRLYNRFTNKPVTGAEFSNFTEIDAFERAKAQVSPASSVEDFKKTYELRDVGTNTGRWSVIRRDNGETLEIIDAATRGEAADQARDKYTDVIPFYIEPYGGDQPAEPEPKLSRRAKLAKQIAQPRDYVIINKHSLLPFYTFRASTMSQAVDFAVTYLRDKGLDVENFSVQRASNAQQAIDNAVDSRRMQQRLDPQVRDIDVTIDQDAGQYEIVDRSNNRVVLQYSADSAADAGDKFNTWLRNQGMPIDTENYGYRPIASTQPWRDQLAQQVRNAAPRSNFELYMHDNPDRVFHTMNNATADEVRAFIDQQEREGMPPGFLRVRQAQAESQQARSANGVPLWDLYDRETGTVLRNIADHNEREAMQQAMSWLRTVGAEDPDTYNDRFAVRPKMSTTTNESDNGDIIAQRALDAAARKVGYANFAAVPQSARNSIMQMARYAPEVAKHYNMLKDKKKKGSE